MPKAKPMVLNPAARRKSEIEERQAAELSLTPISELPPAPAELKGHRAALAVYKKLTALYSEVIAEVVTAFDLGTLVDLCITVEQIGELEELRTSLLRRLTKTRDDEKRTALEDRLLSFDARIERKKVFAHRLRESLYLTPRARAGAAPPRKPAEPEADEMDALLAEAEDVISRD